MRQPLPAQAKGLRAPVGERRAVPRGAEEVSGVSVGGVYIADAAGRAAAPGVRFEWRDARAGGGPIGRVPALRDGARRLYR